MSEAKRDANSVTTLLAVSNVDGVTPVILYADPTTHRLLVSSAGTSLSLLSDVTITSVAQGDILYYNGTKWVNLAHGTSGQLLQTNGINANPSWATVSATAPFADNAAIIKNNADATKLIILSAASITTGTTRTITAPDANTTIPIATQVLTFAGPTAARTITFPDASITVARTDAANTFTGHQTIEGVTSTGATGTGKFVFDGSPTLVTPILGVASATSLATSAASPLLLTNAQLVTVTLTAQTVGGTTLTIPDFASVADEFTFKTKAQTMSNKTFVAPVLGAATATTINKVTITQPASSAVLTLTDGKTLAVTNTLTLSGTDSTVMTFPTTTATIARTDAGQTFTGVNVFTSPKIVTQISDTNGNVLLNIGATASAVNYVKLTNAATGTAGPIIAADGETNVDLKIAGKGTGAIHATSSISGDLTNYTPSAAATATLTLNTSNIHTITMPAGNITIALSNEHVGQVFVIRILQDGTGSRTVTWFTTIKWAGGSAPTLTTTASKADTFVFIVTSAGNYDGYIVGQSV